MLHKSDNESHVHGVFELPHRRLGPDEESAIKSEEQETVTIKNGGGIVNDRLSRDTEMGQSEL